MTVETFTKAPPYTIAGLGPYEIPHPYGAGAIRVFVVIDDLPVELTGSDFSVTPEESETQGDVYLSVGAATTHDGLTLWIDRDTPHEQGWQARTGDREAGMETQLDQGTLANQEDRDRIDASLRGRRPMAPFDPKPGYVPIVRADGLGWQNGPTADEITGAQAAAEAAQAAKDFAEKWAEGTEPGGAGTKSSKEYSEDAATYAGSIQPYASRASAEAATVPAPINRIAVTAPDGSTLHYVKEPSGTALTSGDGAKWSPDGDVTPQHFGAVADGVTDDTDAIQAAFDALPDGAVTILPGSYAVDDVTISDKGNSNSGGFRVIANGAIFVGSGKVIVDGCKRLQIHGLDAPGHSLAQRGMWYSETFGCRFREHLIGDAAGSYGFTSVYWNNHFGGQLQCINVVNTASPTEFYFNANWYQGVTFRGDASQGFTTTSDYGVIIDGAGSVQNLVFYGGDFSEHGEAIYSIADDAPDEVEMIFHGTYFDQNCPERGTPRATTRIITRDCHMSNDLPVASALRAATQGGQTGYRVDRSVSYQPFMPFNLIPNGNLSQDQATWAGSEGPILSPNSATITARATGGPFGRYLNINQALTTSNQVRIRAVTVEVGRHTMQLVIRNADSGARDIRISFGGSPALFETVTILNGNWTFLTLTSETDFAAGDNADILILTQDGTAFNVDVAMMAIYYGENGPLAMSQHPQRDRRDFYWATQYRVGDGSTASRPILLSGTGSPEGVVAAPRSSLYMRTDGSTGTCLYVKETTATNTGWVAK